MAERIINQPEIIKPEFYLEKIGEGGIEFVEQFLKTPGTLAHSINVPIDKKDELKLFFKQLFINGEISYKPFNVGDKTKSFSLFITAVNQSNPIISPFSEYGIINKESECFKKFSSRKYGQPFRYDDFNSKGFIIFNDETNKRIRGEQFVNNEVLDKLIKEPELLEINSFPETKTVKINKYLEVDKTLLWVENRFIGVKYYYLPSWYIAVMKGLRELNNYINGNISREQVFEIIYKNNLLPPCYAPDVLRSVKADTVGIRLIGFDDDGVLKPLPIRKEEINYVALGVRNNDYWKVYQMKQKSR